MIEDVSSYVAKSGEVELPAAVVEKAKNHILGTLAAIVSGSELKSGELEEKCAESQAGPKEAQVVYRRTVTSAINTAFTKAIIAQADETDDSNPGTNTHSGCGIVPAMRAMSEREQADSKSFFRGEVTGYDIGCRMTQAPGVDSLHNMNRCTYSIGNTFGAAAAAASVARPGPGLVRYVLSTWHSRHPVCQSHGSLRMQGVLAPG